MDPKVKVTRIPWEDLVEGRELSVDAGFAWHRGSLRLPGSRKRAFVCYRTGLWKYGLTTEDMLHEAQVLSKLKGVNGVPHFYGVTDAPPIALIMSLCPGRQLKQLQRSQTARTYLAAIREACVVLGKVHRKGVVHGHISASNILVVTRRNREDVSVSIVRFDLAELTKDKDALQADAEGLVTLIGEMADKLSPSSPFYQHRDKLKLSRNIDLTGIVRVLCTVMHDNPAKCPTCKKLRPGK